MSVLVQVEASIVPLAELVPKVMVAFNWHLHLSLPHACQIFVLHSTRLEQALQVDLFHDVVRLVSFSLLSLLLAVRSVFNEPRLEGEIELAILHQLLVYLVRLALLLCILKA